MADPIYPSIPVPDSTDGAVAASYGKELAYDFTAGEFILQDGTPKIVEGIEALKVWIEKAIRTARYRWPVYTFQFGCELEDIVGLDLAPAVLESEVKRVITEALIYDDRIDAVQDFTIERGQNWLKVTFRVVTTLGEDFTQEVSV